LVSAGLAVVFEELELPIGRQNRFHQPVGWVQSLVDVHLKSLDGTDRCWTNWPQSVLWNQRALCTEKMKRLNTQFDVNKKWHFNGILFKIRERCIEDKRKKTHLEGSRAKYI
jgi:hypothetical protein